LDGLPEVVVVAVRERDHVDALGLLLPLGTFRIPEPGVDVDALAAGAVEPESPVPEPGQGAVCHLPPPGRWVESNGGLLAAKANRRNMWHSRTGASAMAVELAAGLILLTAVSDAF